jgi:hypothetical protein
MSCSSLDYLGICTVCNAVVPLESLTDPMSSDPCILLDSKQGRLRHDAALTFSCIQSFKTSRVMPGCVHGSHTPRLCRVRAKRNTTRLGWHMELGTALLKSLWRLGAVV